MHRLELTVTEFEDFRKKARIEMIKQDLTLRDLSDMTGYNMGSLRNFFSFNNSKFIAAAIAKALKMEIAKCVKEF